MKQEDKELLLKDLCARLPYGLRIYLYTSSEFTGSTVVLNSSIYGFIEDVLNNSPYEIKEIKPYLRPMSSMTEEEEIESLDFAWDDDYGRLASYEENIPKYIDWLNAHHFDYRGLIEKGLALEASKGMYNLKE